MLKRISKPFASPALTLLILIASCFIPGCNRDPYNLGKRAPVAGRVTVDGAPLYTGFVTFQPDDARGNKTTHQPTGAIDQEGKYALFTVGAAEAPLGWYKVLVSSYEPAAKQKGKGAMEPKALVNPRYERLETTPLALEVVADPAPGAYDLKLSR